MRILALTALSAVLLGCQQAGTGGSTKLATQEDSVSYILGYKMGENLKQQSVPVNPAVIYGGMQAGFTGKPALMHDSTMQQIMMAFQVKMMGMKAQQDSVAGLENEKAGKEFMDANKSKEGVKTTASGLQYKVIKEGTGAKPKATSTVTVNYVGTLLNGNKFDASADHGGPATFALNQVVPGWTEGVQLMSPGAKYEFWVPAHLGYGPQGSPPVIPPNATLHFEVELLSVK